MPADDSPATIVARFLRTNNYEKSLDAFILEAGLPPDAGSSSKNALTLEKILEEKKIYDQSLAYEKQSTSEQTGWSPNAPSVPTVLNLPQPSNILHVSVASIADESSSELRPSVLVTTADRRLLVSSTTDLQSAGPIHVQDSPILSWTVLAGGRRSIGTSMSGQVFLYDHPSRSVVSYRQDHKKYCVKSAVWCGSPESTLIATIGWDSKLFLYRIPGQLDDANVRLPEPSSSLDLQTIPEDILFLPSPSSPPNPTTTSSTSTATPLPAELILLLTRRDSTHLHYYAPTAPAPTLLSKQNLAPHAITWSTFTPTSVTLSPIDPTLAAIATSALPHLKLIIARLLLPSLPTSESTTSPAQSHQASTSQAPHDPRASPHLATTHENAIQQHVSTLAPQTAYSTPRAVWRPDGSGVWVNGDDGCVRGVETRTGRVVAVLGDGNENGGGHEAGAKVRTLWAGMVGGEEWVVSGGFDRRGVVWRVASSGGGRGG